jgi:hypothetical protein
MNGWTHKTGEHVLVESSAWVAAVTAETFVSSAFRLGLRCVADGLSSDKAVRRDSTEPSTGGSNFGDDDTVDNACVTTTRDVKLLRDSCFRLLDATEAWALAEFSMEGIQGGGKEDADLHASPVSSHLPLHRLLAVCVHAYATACERVASSRISERGVGGADTVKHSVGVDTVSTDATDAVNTTLDLARQDFQRFVFRFPKLATQTLRAVSFADQVNARVWIRNGDEIRRNAVVYNSKFVAGMGRDADFGFTQIALAIAAARDLSDCLSVSGLSEIVRFALAVVRAFPTHHTPPP